MSDPVPPARVFTLASATALLPVIKPILEEMQRDHQHLDETGNRLDELSVAMRQNGHAMEALRLEALALELRTRITNDLTRIIRLGVEIKHIPTGLVDFPALRHGQPVLLCWKLDEPAIAFWHERETGFSGRQPLDFTGDET